MFNKNLPSQRKSSDPWSSFQNEMRDLISRFGDDSNDEFFSRPSQFSPNIEIKDEGKKFLVTAEIPGMSEKDIDIDLDENVLTLQGERRSEHSEEDKKNGSWKSEISYGSFYRTIPLNTEVDEDKVEADYKNGMLRIVLPKKEGMKKKGRKISIGGSDQKKH